MCARYSDVNEARTHEAEAGTHEAEAGTHEAEVEAEAGNTKPLFTISSRGQGRTSNT